MLRWIIQLFLVILIVLDARGETDKKDGEESRRMANVKLNLTDSDDALPGSLSNLPIDFRAHGLSGPSSTIIKLNKPRKSLLARLAETSIKIANGEAKPPNEDDTHDNGKKGENKGPRTTKDELRVLILNVLEVSLRILKELRNLGEALSTNIDILENRGGSQVSDLENRYHPTPGHNNIYAPKNTLYGRIGQKENSIGSRGFIRNVNSIQIDPNDDNDIIVRGSTMQDGHYVGNCVHLINGVPVYDQSNLCPPNTDHSWPTDQQFQQWQTNFQYPWMSNFQYQWPGDQQNYPRYGDQQNYPRYGDQQYQWPGNQQTIPENYHQGRTVKNKKNSSPVSNFHQSLHEQIQNQVKNQIEMVRGTVQNQMMEALKPSGMM